MIIYVFLAISLLITFYYVIRRKCDAILVKDIHKKYVLITGCDSGFGYAAAKRLDKRGCYVIAGCFTDSGKTRLQEECSSRLLAILLDVSSDSSVRQMAQRIRRHVPEEQGLWGIVNNAGILGYFGPMAWYTPQEFMETLNVNVGGIVRVTTELLPLLKQGGGGRIVNTSSVARYSSFPYVAGYCVSKQAVASLSHVMRRELFHFGINVSIVEPGGHKTQILSQDAVKEKTQKAYSNLPPNLKEEYGQHYLEKLIWCGIDLGFSTAAHSLDGVLDAYEKALFSKYPCVFYVVGWDSLLHIAMSWIPAQLVDLAFRMPFGVPVPTRSR